MKQNLCDELCHDIIPDGSGFHIILFTVPEQFFPFGIEHHHAMVRVMRAGTDQTDEQSVSTWKRDEVRFRHENSLLESDCYPRRCSQRERFHGPLLNRQGIFRN